MAIYDETAYADYIAQTKPAKKTSSKAPTSGALPASFKPTLTTPTTSVGNSNFVGPTTQNNNLFVGPIPTGSTRTETGYITSGGTVVSPVTPGVAFNPETPSVINEAPKPPVGGSTAAQTGLGTSGRAILASLLREYGLPDDLINPSISFIESLDADGVKDPEQQVQILMNNKTFTNKAGVTLSSPFYSRYTALGEGVMNPSTGMPYTGKDMLYYRKGIESLVTSRGFDSAYMSEDSIKKYVKNNVSVTDLQERMDAANLRSLEADPAYTGALMQLGYIKTASELKNFFLDPNIGQAVLEQNRATAALATEVVRRAGSGLTLNAQRAAQLAASFGGANEAQIQAQAGRAYGTIAEQLQPLTKYEGIYTKTGAMNASDIQAELENEQFLGLASARRKRLEEQNIRAFQGQSGTAINTQGLLSQRGIGTAGLL